MKTILLTCAGFLAWYIGNYLGKSGHSVLAFVFVFMGAAAVSSAVVSLASLKKAKKLHAEVQELASVLHVQGRYAHDADTRPPSAGGYISSELDYGEGEYPATRLVLSHTLSEYCSRYIDCSLEDMKERVENFLQGRLPASVRAEVFVSHGPELHIELTESQIQMQCIEIYITIPFPKLKFTPMW